MTRYSQGNGGSASHRRIGFSTRRWGMIKGMEKKEIECTVTVILANSGGDAGFVCNRETDSYSDFKIGSDS